MTDRKRDPLPEGYRFGDAACTHSGAIWQGDQTARCLFCGAVVSMEGREMVGLSMATRPIGWNVIEGEHFASDAEQTPVVEGEPMFKPGDVITFKSAYITQRDLGDEA